LSEPAAGGGDTPSPPGSISFVLVTETGVGRAGPVLEVIGAALRAGDEAILLTRSDRIADLPSPAPPWLRVVGLPDASVFGLRRQIPAVARREWVVLFEEHTYMPAAGIAALREMIEARRDIDLIAILGKNLTSVSPWGWANFLHTFARAWAPVAEPPPFAPVTSVALRRAALPGETPLQDGEWELKVVPRLFATGRVGWANAIYIDHHRPLELVSCFAVNFHNGRSGGAQLRRLGMPAPAVIGEGWRDLAQRPQQLVATLAPRWHELPTGTAWRLRIVGLAACLGKTVGALLGPGRSPHMID
jgi:hypothetical protein